MREISAELFIIHDQFVPKHDTSISVSMLAVPGIYRQYSTYTIALWCETPIAHEI